MNVHPACGHSLIEVFIHPNQITGMGLVIGLAGTGGDRHATKQFALNLLQKMGNRVDPQLRDNILRFQEKTDNMSVVLVSLRRTERVIIDPDSDSLEDVVAKRSAISGVTPSVDGARNTLSIEAQGAYSIDFAGRLDNPADSSINSHPEVLKQIMRAANSSLTGSAVEITEPGRAALFLGTRRLTHLLTTLPHEIIEEDMDNGAEP